MRITMKSADYGTILAHAVKCAPKEACGLVGGVETADGVREIRKVYLLTNLDDSSDHFTLDPKEQLRAVKDMRALGIAPLGNWHSHPASPARPSEEDRRLAYDSKATYLILSLVDEERPVLNAFHIEGDMVRKEELVLVD
ncbi:MAG: M67 family metallopeptidase [Deltaproteobacteria bacterium]|nr:M67 family metallopeptidase [Deltaproteobacteria bacterium]